MILIDYPDRNVWAIGAAKAIAGSLADALRERGHATLAVPGGTTPAPVLQALAGHDLDWSRVTVLPTDERQVEETSPRSNARLIREHLISRRPEAEFLPLWSAGAVGSIPPDRLPLDVLVLGMGEDWHIASLFPGGQGLEEALSPEAPPLAVVMPAIGSPMAGEGRVTLTAPVLSAAFSVHLLMTGAAKRAVLDAAPRDDIRLAPVGLVLGRARVHWSE